MKICLLASLQSTVALKRNIITICGNMKKGLAIVIKNLLIKPYKR